jgi:hypothetical protein
MNNEFKMRKIDRVGRWIKRHIGMFCRPSIAVDVKALLGDSHGINYFKVIEVYHITGMIFVNSNKFNGDIPIKPLGGGFGKIKIIDASKIEDEEVKKLVQGIYK